MEKKTTIAAQEAVASPSMTAENSVVIRMAKAYGIREGNLLKSLKSIIFHDPKVSDDEAQAFLLVADKYGLDPWTRQIYPALTKQGAILPVVGVDGWCAIINNHPQADGLMVKAGAKRLMKEILHRNGDDPWLNMEVPEEITVEIYRKDRKFPVVVSESMVECFRATEPWKTHPARMLRHKAIIQAARIAFGFTGIYDPDEAEGIQEIHMGPVEVVKKTIYEEKGMTLEAFVKAIIERVKTKGADMSAVMSYLNRPEFNLTAKDLSVAEQMVRNAQNVTDVVVNDVSDIDESLTQNAKVETNSQEPTQIEAQDELFGNSKE